MRIPYKFIFYIILPLVVLYVLQSNVVFTFSDYRITASSAIVLVILIIIYCLWRILVAIKKMFYWLFIKIDLNDTLADYIKSIEISNQIDKDIQLRLIKNVDDLKTLRIFVRLNQLLQKKQHPQALKLIKHNSKKAKLKNLLNYTKVQIMLAEHRIEEAENLCKFVLNDGKYLESWAFLKLLDIWLNNNAMASQFRYLKSLLINSKINLDRENYGKVYCLVNYNIAKMEYNSNPKATFDDLVVLVKKYPNFIPAYNLVITHLEGLNLKDEAKEYIVKSWSYEITYENTILLENIYRKEDKDFYLKIIDKLKQKAQLKQLDKVWLLLAIINTMYGNYIDAMDSIYNVKNQNLKFFKLSKLYITLREQNVKNLDKVLNELVADTKLNWWNEYIQI